MIFPVAYCFQKDLLNQIRSECQRFNGIPVPGAFSFLVGREKSCLATGQLSGIGEEGILGRGTFAGTCGQNVSLILNTLAWGADKMPSDIYWAVFLAGTSLTLPCLSPHIGTACPLPLQCPWLGLTHPCRLILTHLVPYSRSNKTVVSGLCWGWVPFSLIYCVW